MSGDGDGGDGRAPEGGPLPSRPVSRPPRLRPTTGPAGPSGDGGPRALLRTLSGALLAVAAVALGVVVLLALRGGGDDDTLLTTGGGSSGSDAPVDAAPADPEPAGPAGPEPAGPEPAEPAEPAAAEPQPTTAAGAAPAPPPAQPAPAPPAAEPAPPPPPAVPADVTVTVLGVGGPGTAEATADRLRGAGWNVRLVASYRGDPPSATTLFHVPGREDAAALLAGQVGASAVRPAPSSLSDSDLTLVVSG